jgi:PhnB protein
VISINPYINFNGNAEEAFMFYRSIFGGDFSDIVRFKDIASAEMPVSDTESNKIMRITLPIGGNLLIANDVPDILGKVNEMENRSKISITTDSKQEADRIFIGLSNGGTIEMPIGESFMGYFGMLRDKYGIEWTVEFNQNNI